MTDAAPELKVYWQPGCTSCLAVKTFLTKAGVPFQSINVLVAPDAMADLARLGARSVPVVARGEAFTFAQDMAELAAFVGVPYLAQRLPVDQLIARVDRLLQVSEAATRALPAARLSDLIPARPRRYADIAYHIPMIAQAFLDAAQGAELTFAHFERVPAADQLDPDILGDVAAACRSALQQWWQADTPENRPARLLTFYGDQSLASVLERTAWHMAQHCRQIDFIATHLGVAGMIPTPLRLTAGDLDGLPVPADVWDKEISFAVAQESI